MEQYTGPLKVGDNVKVIACLWHEMELGSGKLSELHLGQVYPIVGINPDGSIVAEWDKDCDVDLMVGEFEVVK